MSANRKTGVIFDLPAPPHDSAIPVPNPTPSFWINTPGANPFASEGSGITGVSAAYHLAKSLKESAQLKVVILEARDFCSGATGRNGGHLTAEIFDHFVFRESKYGSEEAKKAHKLHLQNIRPRK
ncbi:hypothetical protein DXG01_007814, partial [Tephrocybe rancida]